MSLPGYRSKSEYIVFEELKRTEKILQFVAFKYPRRHQKYED